MVDRAGALVPAGMALLLAVELLGVPSCTGAAPVETELRRTDALIAEGQPDDALTILLPLAEAQPAEFLVDRQIARAYAALGRPDREADAWEAFLRKSPAPGDGCVRLGQALLARNEAARFIPTAEECLRRDPAQAEVATQLAMAYEAVGNRAAASEALARARQLDPGNPALVRASEPR